MRTRQSSPWSRFFTRKTALIAAVAVGWASFAAYGSGFTAGNTVPTTKAGTGAGTISGYTVSSIHYNLNASSPQNIDSVTFTLDTAPVAGSTVKAKLVAAGSTWYTCTFVSTAVTCATTSPQATASGSDQLSVVASQ